MRLKKEIKLSKEKVRDSLEMSERLRGAWGSENK